MIRGTGEGTGVRGGGTFTESGAFPVQRGLPVAATERNSVVGDRDRGGGWV